MSPGHQRDDSQASYYFVSHEAGTSDAVRDAGDATAVIEEMPPGTDTDTFAPRAVNAMDSNENPIKSIQHDAVAPAEPQYNPVHLPFASTGMFGGLFRGLFRKKRTRKSAVDQNNRSTSYKVEPKVFFSNERTFLSWMHAAILLAGISIAISAYSDVGSVSAIYGLMILPIAIVFIIYAMIQYAKRSYMISTRSPGPYEDRWGPVILGSIFVVSIVAQFLVKIFTL